MKQAFFLATAALTVWMSGVSSASADSAWIIKKAAWSEADEKNYSNFVESLFDSKCKTVDSCMNGKGNWYRDQDPSSIDWTADCGRFPYLLRSYFAFHNDLPFQGALEVERRDPNDPNPVLKYSARGTYISQRTAAKTGIDGYRFIRRAVEAAYTGVYRVDSRLDIPTGQYGDLYHVKVNRSYIRPGTVVYDPNGHVATVAKVTDDGKITLLDSHPDNTVSRVPYTSAFEAKSPIQGGGFKNWRPVRLVGATQNASGALIGGRIEVPANADTPGFSLEQFNGDQPNAKGTFGAARWATSDGILGSKQFSDVVRARLSVGNVSYDPIKEAREGVNTICSMISDRADSVRPAIDKQMDTKSLPGGRLPLNIFGSDGDWEDYSTPSRDARLKTAAAEFRNLVEKMIGLARGGSPKIEYRGTDLIGDMIKAHDQAAAGCSLTYVKSNGEAQRVSYESAIQRLYAMSFDPYHCVELRWGATASSELASCSTNSGEKLAWYKAESRLRNSLDRKYDKQMGWSLAELQAGADLQAGVGTESQTPLDTRALLVAAASGDVVVAPPSEPTPRPTPAPTPVATPKPLPSPAPSPTPATNVDLCGGRFNGNMTAHGEAAELRVSKTAMTLTVNGEAYVGHGKCGMASGTQAKFNFALDDDQSYVFSGLITLKPDGSILLSADEVKKGKVIDHLSMSKTGR